MSCGGGHLGFPIGIKYRNFVEKRSFSETTGTIETKLLRNDHWKVLNRITVLYADRKSKMTPPQYID
jgi:hypothetical protein